MNGKPEIWRSTTDHVWRVATPDRQIWPATSWRHALRFALWWTENNHHNNQTRHYQVQKPP